MKSIHVSVHGANKIIISKEQELGLSINRTIKIIHPDDDGMDTTVTVFDVDKNGIEIEVEE